MQHITIVMSLIRVVHNSSKREVPFEHPKRSPEIGVFGEPAEEAYIRYIRVYTVPVGVQKGLKRGSF